MATTLIQTHPLLSVHFNAATDFTVLADHCENFAETLIENDDPTLKMALCGRLNAALTLLQPTLLEPVPPHLVESLTVDTLPANSPSLTGMHRALSLLPRPDADAGGAGIFF
jgi:hypothetical protein